KAQRAVLLRARHREQDLQGADQLAVAADRVAQLVLRAERERAIAAHRAGAAAEKVLEERQRLVAVAAGIADLAAGMEGEGARQRVVPLVLEPEPVVLQVAAGQLGR